MTAALIRQAVLASFENLYVNLTRARPNLKRYELIEAMLQALT